MDKPLAILLACVFVVMIGFGLTLPVMPFLIEQKAVAGGAQASGASIHVGLLTAIFPLMQLFFAPLWGKWSDRIGRRPLITMGLSGYAAFLLVFGLGTSLATLYTARVLGGIFSSAILPVAMAYVADVTPQATRGRGMGWLGGSISLGVVVGPALGGFLSGETTHLGARFGHLTISGLAAPFFAAAGLTLLALLGALLWLPESRGGDTLRHRPSGLVLRRGTLMRRIGVLLALSLLTQLGLTLFESTYALYASQMVDYGPTQMAVVFTVCGIGMSLVQAVLVGPLIQRIGEPTLIAAGFALEGLGLWLLVTTTRPLLILVFVSLLALGVGLLSPSLAALLSKKSGDHPGRVLGLQSAALSLGQAGGPLVGGFLFTWHHYGPYWVIAPLLLAAAAGMAWRVWTEKRRERFGAVA